MRHDKVYYILSAVMGFAFHLMFTAAALYRIDIANLTITQLILTGTALEIAVFVFEVPTGIVADLKSRKLSVIIGLFIIGLGFMLEAFTTYFAVIFIAQVVWGFGYTFISGALSSWVSDEAENENIEHIMITGAQLRKLLSVFGIILAAVIGMFNIRLAIYIAGIVFIALGVFSLLFMKEHNFQKTEHKESFLGSYFNQLVRAVKVVNKKRVLRIMFVIMLFYGLYSEGIDRTYELHILDNLNFRSFLELEPIWIIALINAFVAISGYIILFIVKKFLSENKYVAIYAMNFTILMIIGILIFAFLPLEYIALLGFILFSISREGTYPLLDVILLKHTPSDVKATVLSGFGQLDAIGQLLSGFIMVTIGYLLGLQMVYLVTAILLLVPVMLFPAINKKTH